MNKYIFGTLLLLLMLISLQAVTAQTSLPACTASITDTDGDSISDDDGVGGRIDIDKDGDGLIEICDLEGINEIRYQLDGSGYTPDQNATKITQGCPTAGCVGYELVNSLDFDAASSYRSATINTNWTTSTGWTPIGTNSNHFSSIFEGNGHTIANLHIDRAADDRQALFNALGGSGEIRHVGLLDVDVTGRSDVAALVGYNNSRIIRSYVQLGTVTASGDGGTPVGGLAGFNDGGGKIISSFTHVSVMATNNKAGGLVGDNRGSIINSYALGSVQGNRDVGGLVGHQDGGSVRNSYATGSVTGQHDSGGLVGYNEGNIIDSYAHGAVSGGDNTGGLAGESQRSITNSYARGSVTATGGNVGGLVGFGNNNVVASYWDISTTTAMISAGGNPKTADELKSPTAPGMTSADSYHNWSINNWDFGDSSHYPALKYAHGGDNLAACASDITTSSMVLPCGILLSDQPDREGLMGVFFFVGDEDVTADLTPSFSPLRFNYDMAIASVATNVQFSLRPYALNNNATITITDEAGQSYYAPDRADGALSDMVILSEQTTLTVVVTDTIKESTTYTFAITKVPPLVVTEIVVQPSASIDEGGSMSLMLDVTGGSGMYSYVWSQISGSTLVLENTTSATLTVAIPVDFIALGMTVTAITFQVVVSDDFSTISRSKEVTINKINNSNPTIVADDNPARLRVVTVVSDVDGAGSFGYQWQQLELGGEWTNITDATTSTYWLPADPSASIRYRVNIEHTDGQGYSTEYRLGPFRGKFDDDGDGLIDIYTLEDLDDIRNQHINMPNVCGRNNRQPCRGFELRRSLDFNTDASYSTTSNKVTWTSANGWQPIGADAAFDSLFEGNGYTLSGLQINRSDGNVALFSAVDTTGQINNVGLLDVDVRGRDNVASLVGYNAGSIINSYATGEVSGSSSSIGGLVGNNRYTGLIRSSFANVNVRGSEQVGGLVGWHIGRITNSYAAGTVSVTGTDDVSMGGLVGRVGQNDGSIINSYAVGRVIPGVNNASNAGGLVGITTGTVIASYWDTQTSEQQSSAGGDGAIARTTTQLQSLTIPGATPMDTYYGWDTKIWDFGNNEHYPALRYTRGGLNACNADLTVSSALPRCGVALPQQSGRNKGLAGVFLLANAEDVTAQLTPLFSPLNYSYNVTIALAEDVATNIQFRPYAFNDKATIVMTKQSGKRDYFAGKLNGELSHEILLDDTTILQIVVADPINEDTNTTYTFMITVPLMVSEVTLSAQPPANSDGSVNEGSDVSLMLDVIGGSREYSYTWSQISGVALTLETINTAVLNVAIPADFIVSPAAMAEVAFNVMVDDGSATTSRSIILTINRIDNGAPVITAEVSSSRLAILAQTDPDGGDVFSYQWQQLDFGGEWTNVDAATTATYWYQSNPNISIYYRVNIEHTDSQGYSTIAQQGPLRTGVIDDDGDGLIDIYYLEDLDAIRYELNGGGYKVNMDAMTNTRGCPLAGCGGYELRRDLDFNADASYASTSNKVMWTTAPGWRPIGLFRSVFEGNDYTIANLQISRSSNYTGLYTWLHADGKIRNVGLLDVDIKFVSGRPFRMGALVGESFGAIINSYATGAVSGRADVGGLVGQNFGAIINSYFSGEVTGNSRTGGLVSQNYGRITNSYATATVNGNGTTGGLVSISDGSIINSYATGAVFGGNRTGGLVGSGAGSLIVNSYATGAVSGGSGAGGLIGKLHSGGVVASYWDIDENISNSAGGDPKTEKELKSPIDATGIYSEWSSNDWYFGTTRTYPVLRYAKGDNLNACTTDITILSTEKLCGLLLPGQDSQGRSQGLARVFFFADNDTAQMEMTPSFAPFTYSYNMKIVTSDRNIQLRPYASGDNARIAVTKDDIDYFSGNRPNGVLSDQISLNDNATTLTISVTDIIAGTPVNTIYTFVIVRLLPLSVDVSRTQLHFIREPATPDAAGEGVFSYQWQQQQPGSAWTDIAGATTATYWLPENVNGSIRYRVANIQHSGDDGGVTDYPMRGPFRVSADDDSDGLVDIYTLDDLDAIRYQLDGRGYRPDDRAELVMRGCPATGCNGYELMRSLDFNADTSYHTTSNKVIWTTASGWDLLGREDNRFNGLFDGNGHTISGLYINREGFPAGLFSAMESNSEIKHVGLLDIDITGSDDVGALISRNYGSIINSYAIGTVVGVNRVGGLVGRTGTEAKVISSFADVSVKVADSRGGGLVGSNNGLIINSYAVGDVNSDDIAAGGLAGENRGSIINSYATGKVAATENWSGGLVGGNFGSIKNTYARGAATGRNRVGGLVGVNNLEGSSIAYSYATGTVSGTSHVGGLIGQNDGTITTSYWDTDTSRQPDSVAGDPKTTTEFQSPIMAGTTTTAIYYGWSEDDWDFGRSNRYPALNYVRGGDLNACNPDTESASRLPTCGTLLPQQRLGLDRVLLFVNDEDITEMLTPPFTPSRYSYAITTATAIRLTLQPLATSANVTIKITKQDDPTDYFAGKSNDTLSDTISLSHSTTVTIVVTDTLYADITTDTIYTLALTIPLAVAEFAINFTTTNADSTIDEGTVATIMFEVRGGNGDYQYQYKIVDGDAETLLSQLPPPTGLSMPVDVVATASTQQTVELNILVSDSAGHTFEHTEAITIRKVDNGLANITISRETTRTLAVTVGADPDGDAVNPNYAYQWQTRTPAVATQWTNISDATTASYTITDDLAVVGNEFRVQVIYTDGQGYRVLDGVYSNVIEYVLLPMCTNMIADNDDDDVVGTIDIDKDNDGLIELCDLDGVDEMRYQLDGSGYKPSDRATSIMQGCPLVDGAEQCRGYELVRSLDFHEPSSYRDNTTRSDWIAGNGWLPIAANFSSVFDGNGHSIANLYINRTDAVTGSDQGLFSALDGTAQLRNIRLLDVTVQGHTAVSALASSNSGIISNSSASGEVMANSDVGGLVGINDGQIISSFATVAVTVNMNAGGGLVGHNQGAIMNSYAAGDVTGSGNNMGGLVGLNNESGHLANTYAEGTVMGSSQVGGLVGRHHGLIMHSYAAIGTVNGGSSVGGLIGMMSSTATVIASYWDTDTSEQDQSAGGSAQTTTELQTPIAPGTTTTEVYYDWSTNDWDFGNSSHYPALRYATDDRCATDITTMTTVLPCALLLPNQRGRDKGLATVFFFANGLAAVATSVPPFTPLTDSYAMTILIPPGATSQIQLRPYAINDNATIMVTASGATKDYFAAKSNGALSDDIPLTAETTVTIEVTDTINESPVNTTYIFAITRTRLPLEISDIMISPSATIDEGSDVNISYTISGGSGVYEYAHKVDDGAFTSAALPFVYRAPVDLVASDEATQAVRITIRVSDQDDVVEVLEHSEVITVGKIDNGSNFNISAEVDPSRLHVTVAGEDADGDGSFSYQWQQLEPGGVWSNIAGAITPTYGLPAATLISIYYRVNIQHTDGQGYMTNYQIGSFRTGTIDDDGNGLIDIYYLEDLNAIRYALDGSGYRMSMAAAPNTHGCPVSGCNGYELRRSLDFAADTSYSALTNQAIWSANRAIKSAATHPGWLPIGSNDNRFSGVFDGNGFTIANLYTRGGNNTGLFSVLHDDGEIKHVGLLDVYVHGGSNVAALVGQNYGKIISSYVTEGTVVATSSGTSSVGGLVGINGSQVVSSFAKVTVMASGSQAGGLVGRNQDLIINSYATGTVTGGSTIGGLVGYNNRGSIMNSYATGNVSGDQNVGGLMGLQSSGSIINTYAQGRVSGSSGVGGLIGEDRGSITNSYATGNLSRGHSGLVGSRGPVSATQSYWNTDVTTLQTPTAPGTTSTDVYYGWSEDDWDFGDSNHYPVLRYTPGPGNLNACNPDITTPSVVLPCAIPLPNQSGRDQGLAAVFLIADGVDVTAEYIPTFSSLKSDYDVLIVTTATDVELILRPYTIHTHATITVTDQEKQDYFAGKSNGALSDPIMLSDSVTLTLVVTDTINEATVNTTYTVVIRREDPLEVLGITINLESAINADGAINEASMASILFDVVGGVGRYRYEYKLIVGEEEILLAQSQPPVELTIPDNIVATESTQQVVELNIIVRDSGGQTFEYRETFTIQKVDNGVADIVISRATSRTMIAMMGADPDGATDDSAYQWQWRGPGTNAQWMDLESATSTAYTITDEFAVDGNEFRVQAAYTDGQGYRYDALYSKTMRYDLLPRCALAIADRDNDGVESSIDVDKDGDGLIELCDLEGIDEMRYQADGRGYRPNENAINIMRGCPLVDGEERCRGYELVRSLDFNAADSYRNNTTSSKWTAASGWLPLVANYSTVFEGNGHSISGLYIARTEMASGSEQGLFSTLAATAQIKNIRLLDVTIQGLSMVGALASRNSGIIINSLVSGAVEATADVGGLVGINDGHIISSFADVAVSATTNSGGLVGRNQGAITNSYASGDVTASGDNIGGLVGLNNELGRITNTYAEGTVMGASQVGGLVGSHHGMIMNSYATIGGVSGSGSNLGGLIGMASSAATTIASYWDTERSGIESSGGGSGQTTAELQTPIIPGTIATEVYYRWNTSDWDFGDSHHYPALRYASDVDPDICTTEITTSSTVLPCTLLLPGQRGRDRGLAAVFFFVGSEVAPVALTPPFTPLTDNYDMTIIIPQNIDPKIQLRPYAINDNAVIRVTEPGSATDYYAGKLNGALSDEIVLGDETILRIVVTDSIDGASDHTTYTFTIESVREPLAISEFMIEPSVTIDEGSHTTITYTVSGGSGVYEYAYKIDDGTFAQSSPSLVYRAAANLVASDATTQAVSITIRISDQDEAVEVLEHSAVITVHKIDNGSSFSITSEVDALLLRIVTEGDDPDGDGRFSYQWQQLGLAGEWMDIEGATMATYDVPTDLNESIRYRVNIKHTDGQGYITDYQAGPLRASIDDDADGLIDIYYLEDLNALRYQLDGSGYQMDSNAPINTQGCPETGCIGYELRRDLDFADAASYSIIANQAMWTPNAESKAAATNLGWSPIGDNSNRFSGIFDGNGFTIANLYTRGGNNKGLFSVLHSDGEIKNVGLLDVYIQGGSNVATLVAHNYGKITDSYALTGMVTANASGRSPVGGLVGFNQSGSQIISSFADVTVMASNDAVGGLVGRNQGLVINSHALGEVEGMNDVGGLVGRHDDGSVVNSYASGDISGQRSIGGLAGYIGASITNTYAHGDVAGRSNAGGLVGENRGSITNSYATGHNFSVGDNIGGLVGIGNSDNVTQSYWDTDTTRIPAISAGGMAQTTVALQTPTVPGTTSTDVYYGWSEDDWDFGDNSRYPRLRHARGPDNLNACNADITASSAMLSCQVPLPNQSDRNQGLAALFLLADGNDVTAQYIPTFFPLESSYNTVIVSTATEVQLILRPYTINANATITITDQGGTNYFGGKPNGALSDVIRVFDSLTVTVVVTDTIAESTTDTTYTLVIRKVTAFEVSEFTISFLPAANDDGTINEGGTATLTFNVSGGTGIYHYSYKLIAGADEALLSQSPSPANLVIPADTVSANDTDRAVELNIRVGDDGGQTFEHRAMLTVRKVNNGVAELVVSRETTTTLIAMVGSDEDGDPSGYTYQWQSRTSEAGSQWLDIDSATSASYTITDDLASASGEFRVQVTYTDGQNYQAILTSDEIRYTPPGSGLRIRTKVFLEGPLR